MKGKRKSICKAEKIKKLLVNYNYLQNRIK